MKSGVTTKKPSLEGHMPDIISEAVHCPFPRVELPQRTDPLAIEAMRTRARERLRAERVGTIRVEIHTKFEVSYEFNEVARVLISLRQKNETPVPSNREQGSSIIMFSLPYCKECL
jgi:hypothetical protein